MLKLFLLRDWSRGQEQLNIPIILCLTRLALLGSRMITFSMALPSYLNIQADRNKQGIVDYFTSDCRVVHSSKLLWAELRAARQ